MIVPTFAAACAVCASGSLALARRVARRDPRELPSHPADAELAAHDSDPELAGGESARVSARSD